MRWMIYGATGYTGQLLIQEAIARGHRPVIAGRNPEKLATLSRQYDLEYVAFRLDDETTIAEAIADVDIVYHTAGPFVHTSDAMIRACLATNTHYLDITGELSVFENSYRYDDVARKVGVALISGAGFDVVPSDCLGAYVANQVMGATHLETAIFAFSGASAGTTKSVIELLPSGFLVRRNGRLVASPPGEDRITLELPNGKRRQAFSVPWGDISVSYRTTGVPNITSYLALNPALMTIAGIGYPLVKQIMGIDPIRELARNMADRFMKGPDSSTRQESLSYIFARAQNKAGQSASAWLTTLEPYLYTAKIGVLAVERLAELNPVGALSPVQAFGMDFTLELEGSSREDC